MISTVEISMYPLKDEYKPQIIGFIQELNKQEGIKVYTTAMSTYVKGEYQDVMKAITETLAPAFEANGSVSVVMKMIPQDLPVENGFISF